MPEGGYGWNAGFHEQWNQFMVAAPAEAQKAELYARISGHGAVDGTSCGEFCTFTHQFSVNGSDYAHEYIQENFDRCAALVEQGVTPNQGGTWFYDRSSWCPGWTIEEWRADMSEAIEFGADNTLDYSSWFGQTGEPGGGNMNMRVELVFYGE